MTINQLFKNKPPIEIVNELLNIYGLSSLNDSKIFSKIDLIQNDTLNKIDSFKLKIINYYLPCKAKIYLNNIDHKKLITILRQVIKIYGYKINSKEKYLKGEKIITYQIIMLDNNHVKKNNSEYTIVFD